MTFPSARGCRLRRPAIAIGNVIGSKVVSTLGVTLLLAPIPCDAEKIRHDIPVMAATLLLGGMIAASRRLARLARLPVTVAYGWCRITLLA